MGTAPDGVQQLPVHLGETTAPVEGARAIRFAHARITENLTRAHAVGWTRAGGGADLAALVSVAMAMPGRQRPLPPRQRVGGATSSIRLSTWRPDGVLVAHLQDHTDAIVALKVSYDGVFFLSASADGSVRVWDCVRLEKKRTNRHRLLHYQGEIPGSRRRRAERRDAPQLRVRPTNVPLRSSRATARPCVSRAQAPS